eukprot:TRINITY_DN6145_c0_g1_i3.p1 TRINITY_DN6145_c0_g1~~TRINITY_DN6145_c0_g1_i3.p1  ORF type:complete len:257 (-),score=36.59 TRINITY_DN6145_c0_g1_i3:79-756(-)
MALGDDFLEGYKPPRSGLSHATLESVKLYAKATPLVKVCLLLIAARLDSEELEPFRHSFLRIDTDGNGYISENEFVEAFQNLQWRCGHCCLSETQIVDCFAESDLNKNGRLEYSEFLAACLYTQLCSSKGMVETCSHGEALASHAFQVLDTDADGLASIQDIQRFFGSQTSEIPVLESLPRNRLFDVHTFYACLKAGDPTLLFSETSSEDLSETDFEDITRPCCC